MSSAAPRSRTKSARWAVAVLAVLLAGAFILSRANLTFAAGDKDLPLPRFASLRSDQVNLRTGPGERYPVEWVLTHKGLPVEILAEYEVWRKISDWQGTTGWVHERMLAGSRSVMVAGQLRVLRADPDPAAAQVARAEPGVIARLLACAGGWCRIEAQGVKGWLRRGEIWGVLPDETIE